MSKNAACRGFIIRDKASAPLLTTEKVLLAACVASDEHN